MKKKLILTFSFLLIVGLFTERLFSQSTLLRPTICTGSASNGKLLATLGETFISNNSCIRVGAQTGINNGQILNLTCIVGTNDLPNRIAAFVFPNPTTGILNINVDQTNETSLKAELFDLLGNLVFENKSSVNGKTEINLSSTPAGSYVLLLKDNQGVIRFSKIIIKTSI